MSEEESTTPDLVELWRQAAEAHGRSDFEIGSQRSDTASRKNTENEPLGTDPSLLLAAHRIEATWRATRNVWQVLFVV